MMNTYKGVVTIAINQEGFEYKILYNLDYADNVIVYKIIIFKIEVDGIHCFICIGIRTVIFSLNSVF